MSIVVILYPNQRTKIQSHKNEINSSYNLSADWNQVVWTKQA